MTDSGQRLGVENVAAPDPTGTDAALSTLPTGWGSFVSEPDGGVPSHWYASPPWYADRIRERLGRDAWGLESTVYASTWKELCAKAERQQDLYSQLMAVTA